MYKISTIYFSLKYAVNKTILCLVGFIMFVKNTNLHMYLQSNYNAAINENITNTHEHFC